MVLRRSLAIALDSGWDFPREFESHSCRNLFSFSTLLCSIRRPSLLLRLRSVGATKGEGMYALCVGCGRSLHPIPYCRWSAPIPPLAFPVRLAVQAERRSQGRLQSTFPPLRNALVLEVPRPQETDEALTSFSSRDCLIVGLFSM